MPRLMGGPEGARVFQWMEEGPTVFEGVHRILQAYDQATEAVRAAQVDRARLQEQHAALREEFQRLFIELKRVEHERAEAAEWFVAMMLEAAARFPLTRPPA